VQKGFFEKLAVALLVKYMFILIINKNYSCFLIFL